jgi:hypothetical protein
MYAYKIAKKPTNDDPITDWPQYRRLAAIATVTYSEDCGSTWMWLEPLGRPDIRALADPIETSDGMEFYAPANMPGLGEVRRDLDTLRYVIPVTLINGRKIEIVPAELTPRSAMFAADGSVSYGKYSNEYGINADKLHQDSLLYTDLRNRIDAMPKTDIKRGQLEADAQALAETTERLTPKVILQAIQQAYMLTPEMVGAMGIVSDRDFENILYAVWGFDPKKAKAHGGGGDG